MQHSLFIHCPCSGHDGPLACFQSEAMKKVAAGSTWVQALGAHFYRCEMAPSKGCMFNFPGECQTVFQSGCAYTPSSCEWEFLLIATFPLRSSSLKSIIGVIICLVSCILTPLGSTMYRAWGCSSPASAARCPTCCKCSDLTYGMNGKIILSTEHWVSYANSCFINKEFLWRGFLTWGSHI